MKINSIGSKMLDRAVNTGRNNSTVNTNNNSAINFSAFEVKNSPSKLPATVNFLGTYYATTDSHSRLPMAASTLSEIENRIKDRDNKDEPVFLLDCGDFTGDSYSDKSIVDIYTLFQKRNPEITCVFNLGNYDINPLIKNMIGNFGSKNADIIRKMSDGGINIVSATYCEAVDRQRKEGKKRDRLEFIKPYMLLDDTVEGKKQTVLISGVGMANKTTIEDEKAALNYLKQVCKEDGVKADKVILQLHDSVKKANELLEYAKETLGIENIELVIGGHPHSIEDYMHGKTRVVYPPAQGKGAYEIRSTKDGFKFEPLNLSKSGYDYSQLAKNSDVIDNSDINSAFPLKNAYKKILNDSANSEYLRIITEHSPYNFEFRNYDSKVSMPTSFGTFMTNKCRDYTGADISLSRNQLLREKLPLRGKPVNWYNICDSINVNADLYKADINTSKLKEILEISFKQQDKGLTNPSFLEYSDNLRITRRQNPKDGEDIVCQIEIKENDKWNKLLDKNGKPLDNERLFSIVSEDSVACGGLGQFANLNLDTEPADGLTIRDVLTRALREEKSNPDETNYHVSEIINI